MQTVYFPRHKRQLTGTACGKANCNMAAAAMYADRWSLGLIDRTSDELRTLSGTSSRCLNAIKSDDGTTLGEAATALGRIGVPLATSRGWYDPVKWLSLIRGGGYGIVHGDYEFVPNWLSGDNEFDGIHSIACLAHHTDVTFIDGSKGPGYLIGDGLDDGRADYPSGERAPHGLVWWPEGIFNRYAGAYGWRIAAPPGLRFLRARDDYAYVRSTPSRVNAPLGRLTTQTLAHAGTVIGSAVAEDRRWYRVWWAAMGVIAYCHASVVREVPG